MKSIHKIKWLGTLAALLFALVPQMRAQEVDDLQEYLDQLAAAQTESQVQNSSRRGAQSVEIPVGLTEVDLSKFTSYQNRTKEVTVKASVKFTNGTISAASSYAGGTCLLKVYGGATVVLDATAGVNAGAASSTNCLAAVGIYDGSTFYECGDITAPDNGTGIAIYKNGENDNYIYVSGTRKGSIYPDDPFDLQKEIDAIAASADKGSLENPIEIQLPEIYEITSPIIVPNDIFVRIKGGMLKIVNSFSNSNDYVFYVSGNHNGNGTLFIKDVTIDCNNKNLHSFLYNLGETYIEEGVNYQNINATSGKDVGFYYNGRLLYISSGTVRVSGNVIYGKGSTYIYGGVLQGSNVINTNGGGSGVIMMGSGPQVTITGGELIAEGSVIVPSTDTYAGGLTISGGKLSGEALFTQATYYHVNITGGQFNVERLIELTDTGGMGASSVEISGNVSLNVALNIGIHATSTLTSTWKFDCLKTDFNTISLAAGGISSIITSSFVEKQLVVGYNGYELKEVDFQKMSFNNVPDTLIIYYNAESKSVNVKRKVTYNELEKMLAEIKGRQDAWQTAYQEAMTLYNTYSSYLSDEMKAEIEQRAQIVVTRMTELIAMRNSYENELKTAPESEYGNLYDRIANLQNACNAFEAQALAALNALFEDAKAKAAADIAQKLQAIATTISNLQAKISELQGKYADIQSQLGDGYYFMRKPTEELNGVLASADQNIGICFGLTSDAKGLLQDLTSNHSITTAEDIDYFYAQIQIINNALSDAKSNADAAEGCLANAAVMLDALEVNFPDEGLAFTIRPTNLNKELQLGYKSNRGFVMTSAGMMWFEQKEGADFYLKDAEDNYIVATSGSTTLKAGTKAQATVWTGQSIGSGNYTFYSKQVNRYLGYSGINVNNAIIADTKAYSWTITESELDDLQAFLNMLAEEEETGDGGDGGLMEKDTLDIVIPDIDPQNPNPDKPFVFPKLPYPIRILPTPDGGYWPIPRPTPGQPCPADFHPYHIRKGSHVIIDYATFQDLVGGHHVIYVEGVLEININIYVYLTNWEWFIHVGPGGRIIWRTTGGEGTPRIKNEGTMDIEGEGLDYVDNSGTVNHKSGTINWIVNRYIYKFTGGFINLVHNYGTYNHDGGDVITAKNFKEGTYTMKGGKIWNTVVNSMETVFYNYGKFYFYGGFIGGYGSRLIYHDKGAVMWIDGGHFDFTYVKNYWIEAHADYYIRGDYDYGANVPILLAPSVTIRILYKWIYKFNIVFIDGRPTPRYPLFWARDFKFDISYFKYIDWQLPNKRWRWYVDEKENTIEPRDEEVMDEDDLQAYLDWLAENQDGEAASTEENPQELDLKNRDITITKPVVWPTGCHVYIKNGRFTPKTSWTYNYIFYIPATTTVRYEYVTVNVSSTAYYYLNGVPVQRNIFEVYGDFHFGAGCYVEGYVNTSWQPSDTKILGAVVYIDPAARFFLDGGSFKNVIFRINTVVNIYVTKTIVNNIYIYLPTNCRYEDFSFMAPFGGYSFTLEDIQKIIFWNSGSWGIRVLPSNGYMSLLDKILATPIATIESNKVETKRSLVEKGTLVELSSAKEDAAIYYTLDGSDPRIDSEARILYDGTPIAINENTIIKAVAIVPNMGISNVATFIFYNMEGDLNNDGKVDIADGVCVLESMAKDKYEELIDFNDDRKVDIADFVAILEIMAKQ